MTQNIIFLIIVPALAGCCLLLLHDKTRRLVAQLVTLLGLGWVLATLGKQPQDMAVNLIGNFSVVFSATPVSKLLLIFINLFSALVCLFSHHYFELEKHKKAYFSLLVWVMASANCVMLAGDFTLLIFAWGALLALLYAMFYLTSGESARKALHILGLADFCFLFGAGLYVTAMGGTSLVPAERLLLNNPLGWSAYILMLIGALAKAGCGPLHTWIPSAAETTPAPIMALLPASLDKLLGIYLLAKINLDLFVLDARAMALLLLVGSLTIIFAVLMALIQHDGRKLLAFHAISQVGYMVLGFGTGSAIGIAGSFFHMINNALYKSGLFLTAGAVAQKRKTFELEKLGGLAGMMPVTFAAALVFALSISGIPPLNGFASKWMLYQGVLEGMQSAGSLWLRVVFVFALIAAMFGSGMTLASFIKFINAIFLGQKSSDAAEKVKEAPFNRTLPLVILAALCVILGVFYKSFVKGIIAPRLSLDIVILGSWNSVFTFIFIALGLMLGLVVYHANRSKVKRDDNFIGGETDAFAPSFPATEFYRTIEDMRLLKVVYGFLKVKALDLQAVLTGVANVVSYLLYIFVDQAINFVFVLPMLFLRGIGFMVRRPTRK